MSIFFLAVIALVIFLFAYNGFLFLTKHARKNTGFLFSNGISLFFIGLSAIGIALVYFLFPEHNDALFKPSFVSAIAYIGSMLAFLFMQKTKTQFQVLTLLVLCILNCFLLPPEYTLTDGLIPLWAERLILGSVLTLLIWFYPVLNGVDGIIGIQSLSFSLGLLVLCALNALPVIYGGYGAIFAALFLDVCIFTNYPASLTLKDTDCRILALSVGWVSLLAVAEGCWSCVLILNMYYIYELILAVCKKILQTTRHNTLQQNTFYHDAASSGVSPKLISGLIGRINMILIVFAGLQIHAPNAYTMPIVSFLAVIWVITKASSSDQPQHILLTGSLLSALKKSKSKDTDNQ